MDRSMVYRSKVMNLSVTEIKVVRRSSPVIFFKDCAGIQQSRLGWYYEKFSFNLTSSTKLTNYQDSILAEYQCKSKFLYNLQAKTQKTSDLIVHPK